MVKGDEYEKLKKSRDHLKEWIKRHKKAQDVLPCVQENLERTEWAIKALDERPTEATEIRLEGLHPAFSRTHDHLIRVLPMIPKYDPDAVLSATPLSSSATSKVYEYVTKVGDLGTAKAQAYSQEYTTRYNKLITAQGRPQAVRDLLERLNNPNTLERFDRALRTRSVAKSGAGAVTGAASDMRNLLHGLQGDLFEKARKWPKENMTWEEMANRLAKGPPGGTEQKELIAQKKTHSTLTSRLSDITKDRERGSFTNLDNVWTQIIDHTYIVLNLIDFRKLT